MSVAISCEKIPNVEIEFNHDTKKTVIMAAGREELSSNSPMTPFMVEDDTYMSQFASRTFTVHDGTEYLCEKTLRPKFIAESVLYPAAGISSTAGAPRSPLKISVQPSPSGSPVLSRSSSVPTTPKKPHAHKRRSPTLPLGSAPITVPASPPARSAHWSAHKPVSVGETTAGSVAIPTPVVTASDSTASDVDGTFEELMVIASSSLERTRNHLQLV